MEFKINQNVKDVITSAGTLKVVTDKFMGCKIIRDTLHNVLVTGFEDLKIGNSCYVSVPICFANNSIGINTQEISTKLGMYNDTVKFEWNGLETITSEIYFEFGFELKYNPNKDIDGVDDNILYLNYYLVVPDGLLEAGVNIKYTPAYMMLQIASKLMSVLAK